MQKRHSGVVLEPSEADFDAGGAAFGCVFVDGSDANNLYLYYSGSKDREWTHSSIGLALSSDGKKFKKVTEGNPLVDGEKRQFNSKESLTPVVVRLGNFYYMFFAGSEKNPKPLRYGGGRRIGVAYTDDPRGPWKVLGVIAKPEKYWEGWSIDLGPNIVKLSETEVLLFYSNVDNKAPFNILFGPRFWRRSIGILRVKIESPSSMEAMKYKGNPLEHLNGPKGSSNESLFCPGYTSLGSKHFLLPSMSTYSVDHPYHQFIGLIVGDSPYFKNVKGMSVLIDGPKEKKDILLCSRSEIALDTPCPVVKEDGIYVYYSVMDRYDGIWKTALSIVDRKSFAT